MPGALELQSNKLSTEFLILGLGNQLMGDDGAGILASEKMACLAPAGVSVIDGGTIGMSLLPLIESCRGLITFDAAHLGCAAGTVSVLEGEDLFSALSGRRKSAHEASFVDLMSAAQLTDNMPDFNALIAVEPEHIALGLQLSLPVADAIDEMVAEATILLQRWGATMNLNERFS